MADPLYAPEFQDDIRRYSAAKKSIQKKIESLLTNPLGFGEPLKYELAGLCSCPVKKSFIMIYVYCRECRLKGYQQVNGCKDCDKTHDETVKFLVVGPHDKAYEQMKKRR